MLFYWWMATCLLMYNHLVNFPFLKLLYLWVVTPAKLPPLRTQESLGKLLSLSAEERPYIPLTRPLSGSQKQPHWTEKWEVRRGNGLGVWDEGYPFVLQATILDTYPAPWISDKVKAMLYLVHLISIEETTEVPCSPLDLAKWDFRYKDCE